MVSCTSQHSTDANHNKNLTRFQSCRYFIDEVMIDFVNTWFCVFWCYVALVTQLHTECSGYTSWGRQPVRCLVLWYMFNFDNVLQIYFIPNQLNLLQWAWTSTMRDRVKLSCTGETKSHFCIDSRVSLQSLWRTWVGGGGLVEKMVFERTLKLHNVF